MTPVFIMAPTRAGANLLAGVLAQAPGLFTREDSHAGFEIAHGFLHLVGLIEAPIRGVADDEVEIAAPGQCGKHVTLNEVNSAVQL